MSDVPSMPLPRSDTATVLAHFYRGEVGRIMIWRQRMDVTTNWAVGITTALITGGYTQEGGNHFIFVLGYFVLFLLLSIEGRRFRHYHAYLCRVRALEKHFIGAALGGQPLAGSPPPAWCGDLLRDLERPSFKISKCHAIFSRFRKTYYWLYLLLTLIWLLKVVQDCPAPTFRSFVQTFFGGQPFSHPLTCAIVAAVAASLVWLVVGGFFLIPYSEEFDTPKPCPKNGAT
jgi:uncharacterized membrane protein